NSDTSPTPYGAVRSFRFAWVKMTRPRSSIFSLPSQTGTPALCVHWRLSKHEKTVRPSNGFLKLFVTKKRGTRHHAEPLFFVPIVRTDLATPAWPLHSPRRSGRFPRSDIPRLPACPGGHRPLPCYFHRAQNPCSFCLFHSR